MIRSEPPKLHLNTVYRQVYQFSSDSVRNFLRAIELYYANVDGIGVILQPVKIRHMANHS